MSYGFEDDEEEELDEMVGQNYDPEKVKKLLEAIEGTGCIGGGTGKGTLYKGQVLVSEKKFFAICHLAKEVRQSCDQ